MIDHRALAANWLFEPDGDSYVYYPGLFSRGVRITAAEREVFLHGSNAEWLGMINDRDRTEPPRPYWRSLFGRLRTLPIYLLILQVTAGLALLSEAFGAYVGLTRAGTYAPLVIVAYFASGAFLMSLGLAGIWTHWRPRVRNVR